MKAIETPIRKCFSRVNMLGAWYHEYNEHNTSPHSFHRYDSNGQYILNSTKTLDKMISVNDFYISDIKGNKIKGKCNES